MTCGGMDHECQESVVMIKGTLTWHTYSLQSIQWSLSGSKLGWWAHPGCTLLDLCRPTKQPANRSVQLCLRPVGVNHAVHGGLVNVEDGPIPEVDTEVVA